MVSRRKILSRSRDDLNVDMGYGQQVEEEEDIWYQKDKLFKVSWWKTINLLQKHSKFDLLSLFGHIIIASDCIVSQTLKGQLMSFFTQSKFSLH